MFVNQYTMFDTQYTDVGMKSQPTSQVKPHSNLDFESTKEQNFSFAFPPFSLVGGISFLFPATMSANVGTLATSWLQLSLWTFTGIEVSQSAPVDIYYIGRQVGKY